MQILSNMNYISIDIYTGNTICMPSFVIILAKDVRVVVMIEYDGLYNANTFKFPAIL